MSSIVVAFGALALAPVTAGEPFVQVDEYQGNIGYAAAWHLAPAGAPCVAEDLLLRAAKTCSGVRSANSVNGEVFVDLSDTVHTLIVELVYERTSPTNALQLDLLCPDVPRGASGAALDVDHPCYFVTDGDTHLRLRVDKEHWEEHGYTSVGTWSARVFASGSLGTANDLGLDAGLTVEQPFDLYVSVFHHAAAPADYSAVV